MTTKDKNHFSFLKAYALLSPVHDSSLRYFLFLFFKIFLLNLAKTGLEI